MSKTGRRTDLVAERGENLVKNSFLKYLQWVPRTDDPDDGIDLSVEIPPQDGRPSERILVQVKTASAIRPNRDGCWSATIDRPASAKYQRSRHVVFLFRVDLKSEEIRWIDLSKALRKEPDRLTFSLPPDQKLDEPSADSFRLTVLEAMRAQEDCCHPPAQALAYRARQLETRDHRLAGQGRSLAEPSVILSAPKRPFALASSLCLEQRPTPNAWLRPTNTAQEHRSK